MKVLGRKRLHASGNDKLVNPVTNKDIGTNDPIMETLNGLQ